MASPTLSIGVARGIDPGAGGWAEDLITATGLGYRKEGAKAVHVRFASHQVTGWASVAEPVVVLRAGGVDHGALA